MKKEYGKKALSILLVAFMTLPMIPMLTTPVKGATDAQIEASGAAAVAYLASVQNPDGSWGQGGDWVAKTGLVLLKFLARAQELGLDPFDNDPLSPTYYQYANNVIAGFNYLLGTARVVSISPQTHGNPDTNGNGKGIVFGSAISGYHVYNTGIALTALAITGHPNDRSAVIGTLGLRTYQQIAQDTVDWLCFAQGDLGNDRGGFGYVALNNAGGWTDNSNAGYAYLGLAFAEDPPFSCTVPQWVKDELNIWIGTIQDPVNGDADDGGSYYNPDWGPTWENVLKTGNLIFEMAFYGDSPSTPRVQDAVDYLERHWRDPNTDPGWGYSLPVANYQAKFLVEKGLTYMGIDLLDTDGDGVADDDWFNQEPPTVPPEDFASVIVAQQLPAGGWPQSWGAHDNYADAILSTAWAVLTLEKFAPPPEFVKRLVPEEGGLGTVVHVTISVNVGQSQTSTVVDTLPPEFTYIRGTFMVNGMSATPTVKKTPPPPPRSQVISYTLTTPGTYMIEFDVKVTMAYWEDREVCNVVVGTWYDEAGEVIDEKEATACFIIHAFEQLRKDIFHDDWPMFHHDLALSGVSLSTAPNTNETLWIYDTGSSVSSSPAIVDGKLYIGAHDGKLYALDADTGALLWTYQTRGVIYSSPAVAYGKVYFLSTDGNIYALDANTGALIWSVMIGSGGYPWSSPAVHNGIVFIASNGWVHSLAANTGASIWSTHIGGQSNGPIAVVNGKVYSGTHNFNNLAPTLAALDELTGAIIWTYDYHLWHGGVVGFINSNGVSVADGDGDGDLEVYFGVVTWTGPGPQAICLDEATGNEVWTQNINGWSTSTPAVHNGVVFIGSDDHNLYALNAGTGAVMWTYTTGAPVWSAPAVADDKVFVASLDHIFYAIDEATGNIIWSYDTSVSRMEGSPAVACGKVFVGNENGKIYAWGSPSPNVLTIKEKTEVQWTLEIEVTNPFPYTMTNVRIKDRFGAEIEIDPPFPYSITHGTVSYYTKGKSAKVFLTWNIGNLLPCETARLILLVSTDLNPAGHQEYTRPGVYEMNSGATLKFIDPEQDMQLSAVTDSIYVTVLPEEDP